MAIDVSRRDRGIVQLCTLMLATWAMTGCAIPGTIPGPDKSVAKEPETYKPQGDEKAKMNKVRELREFNYDDKADAILESLADRGYPPALEHFVDQEMRRDDDNKDCKSDSDPRIDVNINPYLLELMRQGNSRAIKEVWTCVKNGYEWHADLYNVDDYIAHLAEERQAPGAAHVLALLHAGRLDAIFTYIGDIPPTSILARSRHHRAINLDETERWASKASALVREHGLSAGPAEWKINVDSYVRNAMAISRWHLGLGNLGSANEWYREAQMRLDHVRTEAPNELAEYKQFGPKLERLRKEIDLVAEGACRRQFLGRPVARCGRPACGPVVMRPALNYKT